MHVLDDEDSAAMETAAEILLTLSFFHLSEQKRFAVVKEAAEALQHLSDWQPQPDMVLLGLSTCLDTLVHKCRSAAKAGPEGRAEIAASRMRLNLTGARPLAGSGRE
ncbi:hypothetical protein [Pyruvatibacter mobilis]|uniref:hypothetical protein n=1 Tax=Pyruvatibacter mobilis TaxID=1712261 RepID=UPI003BAC8BD3